MLGTKSARMLHHGALFDGHWAHAFTLADNLYGPV
jgi:hypothetical protein